MLPYMTSGKILFEILLSNFLFTMKEIWKPLVIQWRAEHTEIDTVFACWSTLTTLYDKLSAPHTWNLNEPVGERSVCQNICNRIQVDELACAAQFRKFFEVFFFNYVSLT